MARVARLKFSERDVWYHIHSRIAGCRGEFPLSKPAPTRCLIQTIEHLLMDCRNRGILAMSRGFVSWLQLT